MMSNLTTKLSGLTVLSFLFFTACQSNKQQANYKGRPYTDSVYTGGIQKIPGTLQCEYYDLGGEGIAYHDSDASNSGSGALNPADGTYLHEFRINEAVDISYTKFGLNPIIDDNPYNFAEPQANQLYVGWTEPGEWLNYTVEVKKSGTYELGLMYTANQDGQISLSVDNTDLTGPINIPNTYVLQDSLDWRQWHHWNYLKAMAKIELKKGIHVLTLHTVATGQMNYEHIDFKLID